MLYAALITTWVAFCLTCAAPARSPHLRAAKVFLAVAFAWLIVEGIRYVIVHDGPVS